MIRKLILILFPALSAVFSLGVSAAELKFKDRVMQVRDAAADKGGIEVLFRRHAAIYGIPNGGEKAKRLTEAARTAQKSGKVVEVVVDADALTILRLRPAK